MTDLFAPSHAAALDAADPLPTLRHEFLLPRHGGAEQTYFVGNSLGLQPKGARAHVEEVLDKWANEAVEGHFTGQAQWMTYHELVREPLAGRAACLELCLLGAPITAARAAELGVVTRVVPADQLDAAVQRRADGRLVAVPPETADLQEWAELMAEFTPGVVRAVEYPLVSDDLLALTRAQVRDLAALGQGVSSEELSHA